jgi:hypothetical protein
MLIPGNVRWRLVGVAFLVDVAVPFGEVEFYGRGGFVVFGSFPISKCVSAEVVDSYVKNWRPMVSEAPAFVVQGC